MDRGILDNRLITPGQCLRCGGSGGYPGGRTGVTLCPRCHGDGRDPDRGEGWYLDYVLPVQHAMRAARDDPA